MKKTLSISLLILCPIGGGLFAQNNTLPQTGNVGIGTLTPSSKLDVKGHVRIDSTLMINDSILIHKDARVMQDMKVEGQMFLPNISYANGLADKSFLLKDQSGQIVKGTIYDLQNIIYSKQCPTNPFDPVPNPIWVNGLNKIYIDCPPVNVGIGNSDPRVKLDVSGTTSTNALAIGADPQSMIGLFHLKVTSTAPNNNSTIFLVENNQRNLFQINNNGIVRTREVIVNQLNDWPDYVFQTNYQLQPLKELEKYVLTEHHLPNIPSASSIAQDGVSLGEMNRLLLEKVEELTLHLINQEKRIEELENKLKDNK